MHVDFKRIKMPAGHSHKASGSENEDDVSMHESLREEVASSSDDDSSSDGGSKRPLRDDALPGYSVKDAPSDVKVEEELLLDKGEPDERGQKLNGSRKTRKSRGHTRNAASSNMTGEELKLKLEQSNLRKRRRRSSAAKPERVSTCSMTTVKPCCESSVG